MSTHTLFSVATDGGGGEGIPAIGHGGTTPRMHPPGAVRQPLSSVRRNSSNDGRELKSKAEEELEKRACCFLTTRGSFISNVVGIKSRKLNDFNFDVTS